MSHKYYSVQKQENKDLYKIPLLATKVKKLRFLANNFVGYGQQNELIICKNPGLTIFKINDYQVSRGLQNKLNLNNLLNDFLNELVEGTNNFNITQTKNSSSFKIKEINVNSKASIQIKLKAF